MIFKSPFTGPASNGGSGKARRDRPQLEEKATYSGYEPTAPVPFRVMLDELCSGPGNTGKDGVPGPREILPLLGPGIPLKVIGWV